MFRKMVCPTDLSPAAQNAVEYAAKLCQKTGASLELVHVEPVSSLELLFAGRKKMEEVLNWSQSLEAVARDINKVFKISCSVDVETKNCPIPEVLSAKAGPETLLVVGTNGSDSTFQQFFGSNAFNIVTRAKGPVLVIPENVSFGTIRRVVLAWDYKLSPSLIRQVKDFTNDIGGKLVFVHISKHDTLISRDVFKAVKESVAGNGDEEPLRTDYEFDRMDSTDIYKGLDDYVREKQADVLAISMKSGRLVRHIFGSISEEGTLPSYPLLVIHND